MEKGKEMSKKWVSLRVIERFKNVLFPVDVPLLLRVLPSIGYIVNKKLLKGIIEPGEALITKGNVEVLINTENKTLGVEGRETGEILDSYCELRKFWLDELKPNPGPDTDYIEMYGEGVIKSQKSPLEVFSTFWEHSERIKRLDEIMGFDVTNFGFRLTPANVEPNNPNWFDLRVNPHVIASTDYYYVNLVWRNQNLDTTLIKFKGVNDLLDAVIKEVER